MIKLARRVYTDEQIEYLRKITPGRYNKEITEMFNKKFGTNKSEVAIATVRQRKGIKCTVQHKIQYTNKHIDYLKKLAKEGLFNKEITEKFNKKFNMNKSERAIRSVRAKHGITTSARKKFEKGHTPWNKGLKGLDIGGKETQFKKGEKPPSWVPIGSERITKDGYIQIKIREGQQQRNWRGKHILIWERENGPLPDGCVIIFGDGDNRNFDIDNLICVSRKQLLGLNRHNLIQSDAELTKTAVNIVDLKYKIADLKKRGLKKGG